MKILNLVLLEQSDIKYRIDRFPDGQQQVVIKSSVNCNIPIENGISLSSVKKYPIQIKSRLNNFTDLELIICATKSLKNLGVKEIHLYTPYILGARSDRKFEEGGNRYIKDVIAPILNSLNFESVTCIDPHSYVLENCINNFESITNVELVKYAIANICEKPMTATITGGYTLISPDAGASHKIYKLAEQIGYQGHIITCSKERDTKGKLTKTIVPIIDNIIKFKKDYIIIDDICDGGTTFINIAKEIKSTFSIYSKTEKPKIYLIITHGIFSKGFLESGLYDYFDGIYCTNSYSDLNMPGLKNKEEGHLLLKQLNVF